MFLCFVLFDKLFLFFKFFKGYIIADFINHICSYAFKT